MPPKLNNGVGAEIVVAPMLLLVVPLLATPLKPALLVAMTLVVSNGVAPVN